MNREEDIILVDRIMFYLKKGKIEIVVSCLLAFILSNVYIMSIPTQYQMTEKVLISPRVEILLSGNDLEFVNTKINNDLNRIVEACMAERASEATISVKKTGVFYTITVNAGESEMAEALYENLISSYKQHVRKEIDMSLESLDEMKSDNLKSDDIAERIRYSKMIELRSLRDGLDDSLISVEAGITNHSRPIPPKKGLIYIKSLVIAIIAGLLVSFVRNRKKQLD